jgi:hypothetical protein
VEAARGGDKIALEGLRRIPQLFVIERQSTIDGDTAAQRLGRGLEQSRPIIDELRVWIDEKRATVPPKTPLGAGLGYLHRQWKRLLLFLEDGSIELSNNRVQRELRKARSGEAQLVVHMGGPRR